MNIKLGKNVKNLRETHRMTQKELARELGVAEDYVRFIESGYKTPSVELTIRIAEYFGVTVSDVVGK